MVTMIMMVVISLIVLGISQVARRELQQTTNNQLSTEAFYAAESGINEAWAAINDQLITTGSIAAKSDCTNQSGPYATLQTTISDENNVSYSCLLIDPTPGTLSQDNVGSVPAVFTLHPAGGASLNNVTFSWNLPSHAVGTKDDCPLASKVSGVGQPAGIFTPKADWVCPYGVLRVDLVPGDDLSRTGLLNNTMTVFLVPTKDGSGGSQAYNSQKGAKYAAVCTATKCQFTIGNLSQDLYYARVSQIYTSSRLTITGNGGRAHFADDQVLIDATGKAQDVLRRILVAANINNGNQNQGAGAALASGDSLCKRFAVFEDYYSDQTGSYGQCQQ
jgi:hypothetical protein